MTRQVLDALEVVSLHRQQIDLINQPSVLKRSFNVRCSSSKALTLLSHLVAVAVDLPVSAASAQFPMQEGYILVCILLLGTCTAVQVKGSVAQQWVALSPPASLHHAASDCQ